MNVLIADDDKTFTHLIGAELRLLGWTVTVANDAMQAVMFAVRARQDAIVLDVQMPGGTGVNALKKLKSSSKTKSIPVIIVTVSADPTMEPMLLEMGAAAFFTKPVAIDALHQRLRELCGGAPDANVVEPGAPPGDEPKAEIEQESIDDFDRFD